MAEGRLCRLLEPLEEAFAAYARDYIPNDRQWVLINMDRKEYVLAETLETGLKMFSDSGDCWGLGEVAIGLIRWSEENSASEPPFREGR